MSHELVRVFSEVDDRVRRLERAVDVQDPPALPLDAVVDETLTLATLMMRAYRADRPGDPRVKDLLNSADVLEVFRAFVKGEPSLNAVRDNLRELVYYRNCIDFGRLEALPPKAQVMAVRTIRHIYLYLRGRLVQAGRLPE